MLVLLDRDGVINQDTDESVLKLSDFHLIDGSAKAIARLNRAGFKVAIVTNQSAVGKGLMTQAQLDDIHAHMKELLRQHGAHVAAIYVCTDHPDHATHRRKPSPGMLEEALRDFGALAERTPMVGDAMRDLEAAMASGCLRYLVRTGKGKHTEAFGIPSSLWPVRVAEDLSAAVDHILERFGAKE